jgi:tetratricopeptide (TPR) repeat protein
MDGSDDAPSTDDRIQALLERGQDELFRREYANALETAHELEEWGWNGAAALVGAALQGLERHDEAVAALEHGVERHPENAHLWNELGVQLAGRDRWEPAHAAFDRAKRCGAPHEQDRARFEDALAWAHQGDIERAEREIETGRAAVDPLQALKLARLHAQCRLSRSKPADALAEADRAIAGARAPEDHEEELVLAGLWALRAEAQLALGAPEADVRESLARALRVARSQFRAIELLRELDGKRSPQARRWRLGVSGRCWHTDEEGAMSLTRPTGPNASDPPRARFYSQYVVIADSAAEALELVRPFEPVDVRGSLAILESEDLGPTPDELLGVEDVQSFYQFSLPR